MKSLKHLFLKNFITLACTIIILVSLVMAFVIQHSFQIYLTTHQNQVVQDILYQLSQEYDHDSQSWNLEKVHDVGMVALYDGYFLKLEDAQSQVVWDAKSVDMSECIQIETEISQKMQSVFPFVKGQFEDHIHDLVQNDVVIAKVSLSYFGPYFYSDDDAQFIQGLYLSLLLVSLISAVSAIVYALAIASRLSLPIEKMVLHTQRLSRGDYTHTIDQHVHIREIDQLIDAVNHLSHSLSSSESQKKQLIQDVSHELKTPLTSLRLQIEALKEGLIENNPQQLTQFINEIDFINHLVDDLNLLSNYDSNSLKLKLTTCSLRAIIDQAIQQTQNIQSSQSIKITLIGDDFSVNVDMNRLTQVCVNLIKNATIYSHKNKEIFIKLDSLNHSLQIIDQGYGIAKEDLPFIFDRFYRVEKSRARIHGGSGIGLSITKALCDAHQIKINVESELEKGTTFTLYFHISS